MEMTLFVLKIIAPMLVIVGLYGVIQTKRLADTAYEFVNSPALMLLSAFSALLLGLILVNTHNVWVMGLPLVVTIFGWLSLAAGVARLFAPKLMIRIVNSVMGNITFLKVGCALDGLLGVWLSYIAYFS